MKRQTRFEAWLAESRKLNPDCGCEQRGSRWFMCSYHEGAEDGWEALSNAFIRSLEEG